jgi:glycosyltransferase involved in cell wall biosynthesis
LKLRILILSPAVSPNDAITNDVLLQRDLLRNQGFEAHAAAEFIDPRLAETVEPLHKVLTLLDSTDTWVIYHHGVYWAQGNSIVERARGPLFLRYHNITPAFFFQGRDPVAHYATEEGIRQTRTLVRTGKFRRFIGDSSFNIQDLIEIGAAPQSCFVVAPFHRIDEFGGTTSDPAIAAAMQKETRLKTLFVGRMAPNKGHIHLVRTISRYVDLFGDQIILNVIGDFAHGNPAYLRDIESTINEHGVSNQIHFVQKTPFSGLKAYYENSDIFLLLSEHEGFCVPILEAQSFGLPVITYGATACPETLGPNQLVHSHMDYDWFATALHHVSKTSQLRQSLIAEGHKNLQRFSGRTIASAFFRALDLELREAGLANIPWLNASPANTHIV